MGPSFPSISNKKILHDIKKTYLIKFLKILEYSCESTIKEIILLSSAGTVYGSTKEKIYQEDTSLNLQNFMQLFQRLVKITYNYIQKKIILIIKF